MQAKSKRFLNWSFASQNDENNVFFQLLTIEAIAQQFGISHHYVSTYFKRNMELTLRQYIDNYRMALLQKRLLNSDFTVKEITYAFGFTDESPQ